MKKFKIFAAILTVLFLSSFLTKQLYASEPYSGGDKWQIKSVIGPTTCHLGGQDVGDFKVKIKNIGNVKTTGEHITVSVSITYNSQNLGAQELGFNPDEIGPGKTTTLSILVNNENFRQFTNTVGSKVISVSFNLVSANNSSVTKSFTIKVK